MNTIAIPTYWTKASGIPTDRLYNIYDHPTPLTEEGTLARTLDSLRSLKGDFYVVIIGTMTEPELREKFEKKIRSLLKDFPSLNLLLFTYSAQKAFHQRLEELGKGEMKKYVSLEGYSHIRNLCLILPHLLQSEVALLVDDDEVIVDERFFEKALEFMGQNYEGEKIYGKAGYYTKNERGDYLGSDRVPWWDYFWQKGKAMNQVLKTIAQEPRLKKTSVVFGGAMIIHRQLFEKVSFDPYITRGEDIDYLINAKLQGYDFFLDNQVYVLHLPPEHKSQVLGIRQDLYRFIYEWQKLKLAFKKTSFKKFPLEELDPYPGYFLRGSIVPKGCALSLSTTLRDLFQREGKSDFWGHLNNIKISLYDAFLYAQRNRHRYFEFQKKWPQFTATIKEDKVLREVLFSTRS